MTASLNTFGTSDLCGYSVMINAPKYLTDQVSMLRYQLTGQHENTREGKVNLQIPLVNVLGTEGSSSEEKVLQSVEKIASMIHCFQVSYTGFSFFNAEEACRINIDEQDALISLRDLLQGEFQPHQLLTNAPESAFTMSFAGTENHSTDAVHYEFVEKDTTNNFRVSSLSILKKVVGDQGWELLREVPFGRA